MGWYGILTTNHLTLYSRSAKRHAPDEEEEYVSEEGEHVSEQDQYKSIYLYHRCCPACLDGVRPSQVDMHHGQNPLLIPLLFKFRRMTARRRIDGKVGGVWGSWSIWHSATLNVRYHSKVWVGKIFICFWKRSLMLAKAAFFWSK